MIYHIVPKPKNIKMAVLIYDKDFITNNITRDKLIMIKGSIFQKDIKILIV